MLDSRKELKFLEFVYDLDSMLKSSVWLERPTLLGVMAIELGSLLMCPSSPVNEV